MIAGGCDGSLAPFSSTFHDGSASATSSERVAAANVASAAARNSAPVCTHNVELTSVRPGLHGGGEGIGVWGAGAVVVVVHAAANSRSKASLRMRETLQKKPPLRAAFV